MEKEKKRELLIKSLNDERYNNYLNKTKKKRKNSV